MKKNYNLKKLEWKKNPYAKYLKSSVTIRLDKDVIDYFKRLAVSADVPYQTLINMYLKSCKEEHITPKTIWKKRSA